MTDYSIIVEISSDHQNAVENYLHEMKKQANEGKRFGVDISVRRVDVEDKNVRGFDNE